MIPISDVTRIPLDLRQSRSELKRKAAEDYGRELKKYQKQQFSSRLRRKARLKL